MDCKRDHVPTDRNRAGESQGTRSNSKSTVPHNWRERMPDPAIYYREQVSRLGLPNAAGWAQGCCPFHEDRSASLSVSVINARGGWRCFAGCGAGDLVAFHMRAHGLTFATAVCELLGRRK